MAEGKILVVDDDQSLLELLQIRLESAGYDVVASPGRAETLAAIQKQGFDLMVMDLKLGDGDGIALMEEVHALLPEVPVLILTAHGSIESAVEAMKKGAYSYLTKPFEPTDLLFQIERALENRRLSTEVRRLQDLLEEKFDFSNIIAKSEKMKSVLEMVSRIAKFDSTVFIQGESGTGKELVARAIHMASDRKQMPFVAINCAAIPESLLESQLFGHEKGAFTGAIRTTKGFFTQAHGGTLLLDEIGDMPLAIQAKVLRVLQERQFYPLGSGKPVEVDVRVIVATRRDLEDQVKQGLFREDLFYRIHVIPIRLPSLRERKEDIPFLVEHFLRKYSRQMKKEFQNLSPQAMKKLLLYDWPGNVRELEHAIEFAVAMAGEGLITEEFILQKAPSSAPEDHLKPFKEAKSEFEREYLVRLLTLCHGNVSQASKLAGKYRADFYELLRKHDLRTAEFKGSTEEKEKPSPEN